MYKVIAWSLITRNNEEEVLLIRKSGDHEWTPLGGHVEDQECSKMTVARRATEELGIKINNDDLQVLCIIDRKLDNAYKLHVFFKTAQWEGEFRNMESDIHSEIRWFKLVDLPDDIGPLAAAAVGSLRDKQLYHYKDYVEEEI